MKSILAKNFYTSVQRDLIEPLGLKPTNGGLTTPDDTRPIDFDQALSIVRSLVCDHGKAFYQNDSLAKQLAENVHQRLEKRESWQNGEIDLRDCNLVIADAKASIDQRLKQTIGFLQNWALDTENTTVALRRLQVQLLWKFASASKCSTQNQLAIDQLENLLNSVEDFNELAVCVTGLTPLRPEIDRVLSKDSQGNLKQLVANAYARLSEPAKVEGGLNKWVDQAPLEPEKAARQRAADQILTSLNDPQEFTLELNVRELTNLPTEIGALRHVRLLKIVQGKLENLPDSTRLLTNLQELSLDRNQLESLPDSIDGLIHLRKLSLDSNQLTSLPRSIGGLTNLRELNFDRNQLDSLPDTIGNLTNLQALSFDRNQLKSLPDSIGDLTNLQLLFLENNHFQKLPDSIGKLTNLRKLYLRGNEFQKLPDSISQLQLSAQSRKEIAQIQSKFGTRAVIANQ